MAEGAEAASPADMAAAEGAGAAGLPSEAAAPGFADGADEREPAGLPDGAGVAGWADGADIAGEAGGAADLPDDAGVAGLADGADAAGLADGVAAEGAESGSPADTTAAEGVVAACLPDEASVAGLAGGATTLSDGGDVAGIAAEAAVDGVADGAAAAGPADTVGLADEADAVGFADVAGAAGLSDMPGVAGLADGGAGAEADSAPIGADFAGVADGPAGREAAGPASEVDVAGLADEAPTAALVGGAEAASLADGADVAALADGAVAAGAADGAASGVGGSVGGADIAEVASTAERAPALGLPDGNDIGDAAALAGLDSAGLSHGAVDGSAAEAANPLSAGLASVGAEAVGLADGADIAGSADAAAVVGLAEGAVPDDAGPVGGAAAGPSDAACVAEADGPADGAEVAIGTEAEVGIGDVAVDAAPPAASGEAGGEAAAGAEAQQQPPHAEVWPETLAPAAVGGDAAAGTEAQPPDGLPTIGQQQQPGIALTAEQGTEQGAEQGAEQVAEQGAETAQESPRAVVAPGPAEADAESCRSPTQQVDLRGTLRLHLVDLDRVQSFSASPEQRATWSPGRSWRRLRSASPGVGRRTRSPGSPGSRSEGSPFSRSESPNFGRYFFSPGAGCLFGPNSYGKSAFRLTDIYRTPGFGSAGEWDALIGDGSAASPSCRATSPLQQQESCSKLARGLSPHLDRHEERKRDQEGKRQLLSSPGCGSPMISQGSLKMTSSRDAKQVFQKLYEDVSDRDTKRKALVESRVTDNKKACQQFKVEMPKELEKKVMKDREGVLWTRLHQEHLKVQEKRKEAEEERVSREKALMSQPQLSTKTQKMAQSFDPWQARITDRMAKRAEKIQALEQEKSAREMEGVTFRPEIKAKSQTLFSASWETQQDREEKHRKKMERLRHERAMTEVEECTFAPQINAASRRIAAVASREVVEPHERLHAEARQKQALAQASETLEQLAAFLRKKGMRVSDLFGGRPSQARGGAAAQALVDAASRAGLPLSSAGCRALLGCLVLEQTDGLDVARLEAAVRARQRGVEPLEIFAAGEGSRPVESPAVGAVSFGTLSARWLGDRSPASRSDAEERASPTLPAPAPTAKPPAQADSSPPACDEVEDAGYVGDVAICPKCGLMLKRRELRGHRIAHIVDRRRVSFDPGSGTAQPVLSMKIAPPGSGAEAAFVAPDQAGGVLRDLVELYHIVGGPIQTVHLKASKAAGAPRASRTSGSSSGSGAEKRQCFDPAFIVEHLCSMGVPESQVKVHEESAVRESLLWRFPVLTAKDSPASPSTAAASSNASPKSEVTTSPMSSRSPQRSAVGSVVSSPARSAPGRRRGTAEPPCAASAPQTTLVRKPHQVTYDNFMKELECLNTTLTSSAGVANSPSSRPTAAARASWNASFPWRSGASAASGAPMPAASPGKARPAFGLELLH